MAILLTCEHGGNKIPLKYRKHFKNAGAVLKTHRGLDIGALEIAKLMQKKLNIPLVYATTSRLVVDLNRTLKNPTLFSEFTTKLSKAEKKKILDKYYFPHWKKVRKTVASLKKSDETLFHIAVHSMTDDLNGQKRRMQLALLYNPKVKSEVRFVAAWMRTLRQEFPDYIIARNKPYRGDGDGLTCELRKENAKYIGVEIEMNQRLLLQMKPHERKQLSVKLAKSLKAAVKTAN